MRKFSLEKGFLILLMGLLGASCTKEAQQEPFETTPAVTAPADTISAPVAIAATTTTTTTTTLTTGTPVGYASYNGTTKGGQGGKAVTVTTLSALQSAASSSSPMIITVSGTIKGSGLIKVASNKTIVGKSGATFDNLGLNISGSNSVIVQNITFKNLTKDDGIRVINNAHHVWIDHCTFLGVQYDGMVDITQAADYVTLSWNKFSGSNKNILIGSDDAWTADRGKLHVTLFANYFTNDVQRNPSVRFGKVHVMNNYYTNTSTGTSSYGVACRIEATVRTDNNYFDNFKGNPIITMGTNPGKVSGATTNLYVNSDKNSISTSASTWKPEYSYSTALIAAANVPSKVKAGAGAK